VQFNVAQREVILKVVYYGPPLSGKTTNLQAIHKLLDPTVSGRLTTLNTADDRTLFFDLLPLLYRTRSDYQVKLKLFTVPGQVIHAATRRVVLAGADGVVFVADSKRSEGSVNNEYWHGMRHYMEETGLDPETIPLVIQFNKRDLPDARTDDEIKKIRERSSHRVFEAVAIRGEGVVETLRGLLEVALLDLNKRYEIESKFQMASSEMLDAVFKNAKASVNVAAEGGR
jgi:mutual gliding-motility protein MglA